MRWAARRAHARTRGKPASGETPQPLMVMMVPGLLALAFGFFAFRSRVSGVYLPIITQALTYALLLAFFRNDMGLGGNNGLTDFKDMIGLDLRSDRIRAGLLLASAVTLVASLLVARAVVTSRLGKVLVAVRDAESRIRVLGYRPEHYKLFVLSAVIAGIGGALYVPQVGIINPGEFAPANSIEAVIWSWSVAAAHWSARCWPTPARRC